MTDPLTITLAAAIFGLFVFIDVLRANRSLPFTPSPCERDAQDGRGEGGEGAEFRTIHNLGDTHVG